MNVQRQLVLLSCVISGYGSVQHLNFQTLASTLQLKQLQVQGYQRLHSAGAASVKAPAWLQTRTADMPLYPPASKVQRQRLLAEFS